MYLSSIYLLINSYWEENCTYIVFSDWKKYSLVIFLHMITRLEIFPSPIWRVDELMLSCLLWLEYYYFFFVQTNLYILLIHALYIVISFVWMLNSSSKVINQLIQKWSWMRYHDRLGNALNISWRDKAPVAEEQAIFNGFLKVSKCIFI